MTATPHPTTPAERLADLKRQLANARRCRQRLVAQYSNSEAFATECQPGRMMVLSCDIAHLVEEIAKLKGEQNV